MHASLPRTLEGIAHQLHHVVLPALDDAYAAAQVRAAIELLGNLATRVVLDPQRQLAAVRADRALLTEVLGVAAQDTDPVDALLAPARAALDAPVPDAEDAVAVDRAARDHLAAVAACVTWLGAATDPTTQALLARVRARLGEALATDLAGLRTASYGR